MDNVESICLFPNFECKQINDTNTENSKHLVVTVNDITVYYLNFVAAKFRTMKNN